MKLSSIHFALHRLTPQVAKQVANGHPRARNWERDYPAEGDTDSAQMYLRQCQNGSDPQPFGPYQIVRLHDGKVIGSAGFHGPPVEGVVEIGYGIVPSARGHGFATAAALAVINIARANGARRAIARTETTNPASMKVLANIGMAIIKRDGESLTYAIDLALTVAEESFDSADAKRLVASLDAELARYYVPSQMFGRNLRAEQLAAGQGLFLVARIDGQAKGCGALRRLDALTVEIKRMYVEPELRGRGIARLILERLTASARNMGARRLVLETGIHQLDAIGLYRRVGFKAIPCWGDYAEARTSLCFEKEIEAQ